MTELEKGPWSKTDNLEDRLDQMSDAELAACEHRIVELHKMLKSERVRSAPDERKIGTLLEYLIASLIPLGDYYSAADALPWPTRSGGEHLAELDQRLLRAERALHRARARR